MRKTIFRIIAWVLTLTMLLTTAAFAEAPDDSASGFRADRTYETHEDARKTPDTPTAKQSYTLPEAGTYCKGELLVKVKQTVSLQSERDKFAEYASNCEYLFSVENEADAVRLLSVEPARSDWYLLTLKEDADMLSSWQSIAEMDNVAAVEPNYVRNVCATTENIMDADPYIHAQTWLDRIHAVDAWEDGANIGSGVVVAVVDSGVDMDHPDLTENLVSGYDYADNDSNPDDEDGHGTHVAGIIAACNNAIGVRGVAYGAKIMPVRVLGADGSGSSANIAAGIRYAADHGADIINMSLGGVHRSALEEDAVRYARNSGCLVVAAAGNDNLPTALSGSDTYGGVYASPANFPGVLTVMAADETGSLASFSNYDTDIGKGSEYEIMAPGVNILSTTYDGGYGYMSGTSMACPVVAGAAAILMSMGCDADSAFQIISSCAKTSAGRVEYNYSSLDLSACVDRAKINPAFNTAPVVTNCSVKASLGDIDFGHGSVSFDAMNTTSRVYYYNGAFKSGLSFTFENIGGNGDVTITGSVGGCPIISRKYSVKLGGGESGSLMLSGVATSGSLQFSGTPAVDSDGDVEITLYANGTLIYRGWMAAYDLKTLPTSSFYYSRTYVDDEYVWTAELQARASSLTLSGSNTKGTVWVLDTITRVPAGNSLYFEWQSGQKSCIVYTAGSCYIQTGYISSSGSSGQLCFSDVILMGETGFAAFTSSGSNAIELYGCTVYDPYIYGIRYAAQNAYYNNGFSPRVLQGNSIYISGFYDCTGLEVDCNYFWGNMVNGCVDSQITASRYISNNTFAENFDSVTGSTLKCYAPDYGGTDIGFYDNCVIGPIKVYQTGSSSTPAKVYRVYHQSVGTTDEWGDPVLPTDVTDKIYCASTSTTTESISTLQSWGVNRGCPAFVTGMETLDYEIDPYNDCAINYRLRFHFSAPVILPAWASFYSYSDEMTGTATKQLSADGYYCDVAGTTINNGMSTEHWYRLSDYYQYSIQIDGQAWYLWNTAMYNQSSYQYPVRYDDWYYNSRLDMIGVFGNQDSRMIYWSDDRITESYRAEVLYSINGGEYVSLANNISGSQYIDSSSMESDTLLSYKVVLTGSGVNRLQGTTTYLISLPDTQQGIDLSVGAFTAADINALSASAQGKLLLDGCLTLIFPGLHATAVTFGEAVTSAGIAYGAISGDDGTMVYLGYNDSAILNGGETLFTLSVQANDGEKTVIVTNGGELQDWVKMDSVMYTTTVGVRIAQDSNDSAMQLWNGGSENCFLARYNAAGKLLEIAEPLGAFSMEAPESGCVKLFFLADNHTPQRENITVTAQG